MINFEPDKPLDKKTSDTLDAMIRHNDRVDINNIFMRGMGISFDEYEKLPTNNHRTVCHKHFTENCEICNFIKNTTNGLR